MHRSLVVLALALLGCNPEPAPLDAGNDDAGGGTDAPPTTDGGDGLPPAPPEGEWIAIEPGGDTICAHGTPYRFFVRGGRADRVIVDFQGGGACWDDLTCGFAGATGLFSDDVGTLAEFTAALEGPLNGGMLSAHADNPFRDWTIIHVPYCTGDVHWGDREMMYSDETIHHKGFVNASAALRWAYSRYEGPDNILVSGCSAGAYGAVLHSAYIANHYDDASIAVFADSGAGIITDTFLNDSLPNWNAEANLPSAFVPGLDRPITELALVDVYVEIGRTFPMMRMAQTQAQFDQDQIFFFSAMGGDAAEWPMRMRDGITAIRGEIDNFTAYVPGGSMHCAGIYPFFLTREVNGENLAEWTESLALGPETPAPVLCEGAGCCEDQVCDACEASGDAEIWCNFCDSWPDDWAAQCPPEG